MMKILNPRRNHNHKQQQQRQRNHNSEDNYDDDMLLPGMIQSPTGSLSTSSSEDFCASPQLYVSTARVQRERIPAIRSSKSNPRLRRRSEADITNASIIGGAEIIKRQLSSEYHQHRSSGDLASPSRIRTARRRNTTAAIGKDDWDRCEDEKTAKLLQKANDIVSGTHRSGSFQKQPEQRNEPIVQRVSELDNSSFASSSSNNDGYLPRNLLFGLGCGGAGLLEPKEERIVAIRPVEDMDTSTLDFLATLHTPEEEDDDDDQGFVQQQQRRSAATTPVPRVTSAASPFQSMISPRSSFHEELETDPAFRHALKAGTLWQSLCSQHVRFPALWWDGKKPIGPPMGSTQKKAWKYLGRHRVQGDYKLNSLIGNRGSSGRILLHVIVRDAVSGEPTEDICCGCFHPNARGVRVGRDYDPRYEDCRDVWIAHRKRVHDEDQDDGDDEDDDAHTWTTTESLLRHQNKGRVDTSPLGAQGGKNKRLVNNDNLKAVFGSKPPVFTVFVGETELYELFQTRLDGTVPASVALLRHYLKYRIG